MVVASPRSGVGDSTNVPVDTFDSCECVVLGGVAVLLRACTGDARGEGREAVALKLLRVRGLAPGVLGLDPAAARIRLSVRPPANEALAALFARAKRPARVGLVVCELGEPLPLGEAACPAA